MYGILIPYKISLGEQDFHSLFFNQYSLAIHLYIRTDKYSYIFLCIVKESVQVLSPGKNGPQKFVPF